MQTRDWSKTSRTTFILSDIMKITAPGKLMLSGEWSVLENEVPCIVMSIDQKVSVEIFESKEINFSTIGNPLKAKAFFKNKKLTVNGNENEKAFYLFVEKASEATLNYLEESNILIKNFSIVTNSSDTLVTLKDGKKAKVGFGSSAAIVSATIAAILNFHGQEISSLSAKETIYKLGCIAHYLAQGKLGSSFDVAASTYGGVLKYQKPDMNFILKKIEENTKIKDLIEMPWPYFIAEPINLPDNFLLSIGFVGYSASTKELITKIKEFKKENEKEYSQIINKIKGVTLNLEIALKNNEKEKIIELLKENRILLKELNDKSKNNLETTELSILANIAEKNNAAGKFSGAGGGDCGIAISFEENVKEKIENEWAKNNIYLINANISKKGVVSQC